MARLVPAATQLLSQIDRKFKVKSGEPDGLGYVRTITLDATTSRWLVPILAAIGDERIADVHYEGKGQATITFVPDYRADFKTPFPLDEVDHILND